MSKRTIKKSSVTVTFQTELAKELFMTVISEYSGALSDTMRIYQESKKDDHREVEPKIFVGKDSIMVESLFSDKGLVISKKGYSDYKEIEVGEKFGQVGVTKGRTGLIVYEKTSKDKADRMIGFAPSIKEVYEELNKEDIDVKKIKPFVEKRK